MVNFNVNPAFAYNTPSIVTPNDVTAWDSFIYGYYSDNYYSSGSSSETNYTQLFDVSSSKNIIISKSRFDNTTSNWQLDDRNLVSYFYYNFIDEIDNVRFKQLNIPYGNGVVSYLWQYVLWNEPKTWLFNDVVKNIILVIGPIGDKGTELGGVYPEPTPQTLTFSENFTVLNNNPNYTQLSIENNSITSVEGYAVLYFHGSYNKITITPSLETLFMGSSIKFGFLNKPSIFNLKPSSRIYKGIKINVDNNSQISELITNPYPFEIPTIDYSNYDNNFVTFNIYEKEQ